MHRLKSEPTGLASYVRLVVIERSRDVSAHSICASVGKKM